MAGAIRVTTESDVEVDPAAAESGEADTVISGRSYESEEAKAGLRSRFVIPAVVAFLVLVIVVAGAIGSISAIAAGTASDADARDRQILNVASGMAANLVTLGKDNADADLSRVIDGTTGDFREQFVSAAVGFGELLAEGGVESVGEVKSAGIVDSNDETAIVLAAVTSTVKNNEAPTGEVRVYRMKLTLADIEGKWLVSNVEFVA